MDIQKHLPALGVLVLIVLGLAYWFTQGSDPSSSFEGMQSTATTTPDAEQDASDVSDTAGAPLAPSGGIGVSAPAGGPAVNIVAYWTVFNDAKWHYTFKYRTDWEYGVTNSEDGDIEQVTFTAKDGSRIFVSRNTPLAEPKLIEYETMTRTVAGQEVEVRQYMNPNETYAYYQYLVLPAGNYDYYIAVRSTSPSPKFADDFLSRIAVK